MSAADETAFPRGGHRTPSTTPDASRKRHGDDFLFGKPEESSLSKKKRHSKRRKVESSMSTTPSSLLLPVGGGGVSTAAFFQKGSSYRSTFLLQTSQGNQVVGRCEGSP